MKKLTAADMRRIGALVNHFIENKDKFSTLLYQLQGYVSSSKVLSKLAHSFKQRVKDPDHLQSKLERKLIEAKEIGSRFQITADNLFRVINDLAGFRIIHLHTRQVEDIHNELLAIFEEQRWILIEGPIAKTWDDESRTYFRALNWETEDSESMYTSVHYVVQPNSRSEITCEIQVRTLMEEVWGEVDHTINYPIKSANRSCREQIKVLARLTSSCSRLVDSIFLASAEPQSSAPPPARPKRVSLRKPRSSDDATPAA